MTRPEAAFESRQVFALQARLSLGREAYANPLVDRCAGMALPSLPFRDDMNDKTPKAGEVIPFGKHKGTPIEVLQETDPKYLDWLSQQDWFRQKYGTIYQVIINHGNEPSETPEHNALQLKFLDLDFKRAAWLLATRGEDVPPQIHSAFEEDGIDVLLAADEIHAAIELKPVMGDDYPAVVRQVRGYTQIVKRRYGDPHACLGVVVGSFQSQVATLEQLGEMFKDIEFLTVAQVERFKRFVPEGIAQRKYTTAAIRHLALEQTIKRLIGNKHADSLRDLGGLDHIEDAHAVIEAVDACGPQPNWNEATEWKQRRRAALEQALSEQMVLAHGAMVKAKEALDALIAASKGEG